MSTKAGPCCWSLATRASGLVNYNVEDPRFRLLTAGADVDKDSEIDPTQRAANSEGRSPAAIQVSTFSNELRSSSDGESKAIGISVKDRGAISMAGHSGTAYGFSKASGQFVTSNYYLDRYPQWVEQWNKEGQVQRYANTKWNLLREKDSYLFGAMDDRAWETEVGGFGRVFPHPYGSGESPYFTTVPKNAARGATGSIPGTRAVRTGSIIMPITDEARYLPHKKKRQSMNAVVRYGWC